jgi:hypothetical protein
MMERLIAGTAAFLMLLAPATHAAGSVAVSAHGSSEASRGSAAGFETSLVGSLVASGLAGQASVQGARASFEAIASSAEAGARFVIVSLHFAEDVAIVTLHASAVGTSAAAQSGIEVLEFTVELSRAVFEGSLAASETALTAIVNGTEMAVLATLLTAGTAGQMIGYSFALAEDPGVVAFVLLNDLGRQLYAAQIG